MSKTLHYGELDGLDYTKGRKPLRTLDVVPGRLKHQNANLESIANRLAEVLDRLEGDSQSAAKGEMDAKPPSRGLLNDIDALLNGNDEHLTNIAVALRAIEERIFSPEYVTVMRPSDPAA